MAITPGALAGTAYLSVDGENFMLAGEMSYGVSSVSRETLKGMDGVHGYSETPEAGFIAANLRDSGGLSVSRLNQMKNVTVVLELVNGKTITGTNMWTVNAQEVNGSDATIAVRWEGQYVEEVM